MCKVCHRESAAFRNRSCYLRLNRQSSLLDKESDVEEQEEDTAADSESDVDGQPARDIKLRPRKRVSFKLDDAPSAHDAFQVGTLQQLPAICGQAEHVLCVSDCVAYYVSHYKHAASLQVIFISLLSSTMFAQQPLSSPASHLAAQHWLLLECNQTCQYCNS